MRHYLLTSDTPDLPQRAFRKLFWSTRPATLEGGKGGSAPAAPDPYVTADATTKTNTQTAAFNKALNASNYSNPFGSQTQVQIGVDQDTGAPIYQTNLTANSQLQGAISGLFGQIPNSQNVQGDVQSGLYSLNNNYGGLGSQFSNLAQQQLGLNSGIGSLQNQFSQLGNNVGGLQGQYAQLGGNIGSLAPGFGNINSQLSGLNSQLSQGQAQAAQQQGQKAAYAAQTQYLDPQFSQQKESLDASLANSGLTPGSEAYNNAMTNFNNQKQQAYSNAQNQAIMTGSQIGAQNLQNQIAGINTQAGLLGQQGSNLLNTANLYGQQGGLLGQQAGLFGQQGSLLGQQAGLYGLQGNNIAGAGSLYGQQGNAYGSQGSVLGQLLGSSQLPYSQLSSLAQLVPGYTGSAQASANPADIAGNINNAYQAQLAGHNADVQSANSTTGAIAGLAGAAALAFF